MTIVVLGAGPTGLGAAHRLAELGHDDWEVFEATDHVGGLASSVTDATGFLWDHGGHVMFSHYPYVDELVARALGDDYERHVRKAYVRIAGRLVPYPLQHNIHRLPPDVYEECLDGIVAAQAARGAEAAPPGNFAEWLDSVFGAGLVRHFLRPYNLKVWSHPLESMSYEWQGERVPVVDVERICANAAANRDDVGWGPNAEFTFPLRGTGMLYERIAAALPRPVRLNARATSIDPVERAVTFADGTVARYEQLVSTMPITSLVRCIDGVPDAVIDAAETLLHTSGVFVGIGLDGEAPPERCWVYFVDEDAPFYRLTYLSNYSREMTPAPGQFSLLTEISVSAFRPFNSTEAVDRTIDALVRHEVITERQAATDIVSRTVFGVRHSYPVPTIGRDEALATMHAWLEPLGIHSRGRFGAWRYEIGNTDHSLMMGVEIIDRILDGAAELVWAS
jgi:protoporphyrinogen oxidase